MKKNYLFLIITLAWCHSTIAQNIGISATGATPAASAMLDIVATDKGLLVPRVALTATNSASPVTSPATSLLVYNTATAGTAPNNVVPGYYYWTGTAWLSFFSSTSRWNTTGNAGTTAGTNFIGTTDAVDFVVKTNNTEKARISSTGNLGLGTAAFNGTNPEKLLIDAGTTTSVNAIVGKGSINNYLQLNIQNQSAGTNASSDVVATANNGSETTNYVDMGINSSTNSSGIMGGANDAYLYNIGQNFLLGTGTAAKSLIFMTGGTSQASHERMRISGTGNVGIANVSPSEKLDVTGNVKFSGALMPNNNAGASGNILQSNGAGVAPTWVAPTASSWSLTGNSGTTAGTNFIGTTDAKDLVFKTNNTEVVRMYSDGQIDINAGTGAGNTAGTAIGIVGDYKNYLEFNIQNTSNANLASSDVVATADNGTASSFYVDMGINSSSYTNNLTNILNGVNLAYLYANADHFKIGNGTPGKSLIFFTNPTSGTLGTNSANGVERMAILESGNVGIGTATPNSTLSVAGSLTMTYRSGASSYTLLTTDYVIIHTGSAATWTLPAASACSGRIYRLINQGTGNITLSQNVTTANATTTTTLPFGATGNFEIISDGTVWRKIN